MPFVLNSLNSVSAKLDLKSPKHGGDLAYWQRKVGGEALNWLDLSSACNREPWPIPEVDSALWMALPDQTALLDLAEDYYGVRPSVIGSGSQQIIEALPLLLRGDCADGGQFLKRVLIPRIGYQEHAFAWQKWGYDLAYYDSLDELLEQNWTVAVVIHPNNPTGEWASAESLSELTSYAEQQDVVLVVDEAFIDTRPELSLLANQEQQNWSESLFVLRSVGKFFGLAGARVGFAFCAPRWQKALKNLMGPWPVSTVSLHLVGLAFSDKDWQSSALLSLEARQAAFIERVMPKFNTIFDSQERAMNPLFITWQLESQEYAEQVFHMLHQVGIHIRIGDGWIRVALPAMNEMDRLDKALIRLLKGAGGRDLA
ncbi:aminotransferase class I/II-fold pyridoxal phosphate-dependent enzyme [Marinomonas transparens]|uniref:Aminotransferase n=1 Tax=Marinomonas transparens TaxID=2795388 RepID=A0A934N3H1_9GAMM|nr:aminotransferase class I/II-fold pyridoxal phosphate-dependent enzyme [Marinomonas transparens]MBJ7538988.1 aminotransferase class I/II-fold pyridoxal phosphate-dependent enzyme [Marinomonas transparens]